METSVRKFGLGFPVIYRGKTYTFPGHICAITDDGQYVVRAVGTPDGHYAGMKHIYGESQLEFWDGEDISRAALSRHRKGSEADGQ